MRNLLSIFSFKNRNQFAAIGLFVAAVIVLEVSFSFLPPNSLVGAFRVNRTLPDPAPDFQIMGDSVARDGLLANHLQAYVPAGKTVHNAAVAASGPEFPYFILKRQIETGKAPKTILYGPSPHTFASKRVALLVGAFCDWNEILEIVRSRKEFCETAYGVVCKMSYTFRHREQIANIVKGNSPLFAKNNKSQPLSPEALAEIAAKRRYTVEKLHPMYKKKFEVQPFNRYFYEKFLELAKQNGIQVYWVSMPVLPAVAESRKEVQFDENYFAFLQEAQQKFGVKILQKEFLVFEDRDFKDQTHLDIPAAERFTKFVGEKIATLPAERVGDSAKR